MNIIKHKKIFLLISAFVVLVSVAVVAKYGLLVGIDFTGGALTEVAYETGTTDDGQELVAPTQDDVDAQLAALDFELGGYSLRASVTDDGRDGFILRTRDLSEDERTALQATLTEELPHAEVTRFTSIGPVIGEELRDKAVYAVGAVVLIIVLYVAFAFRGVGKPVSSWVYGVITILALLHDVLIPTAVMAFLGQVAGVEVDVLFVTAILAVLGYSVNDTIVVFDRVRENLLKYREERKLKVKNELGQPEEQIDYVLTKPFATIVGESVDQTLLRSILTSLTTALAVGALYFFGSAATANFALTLLVGIIAGTYSSIFLANPLLVWWAEHKGLDGTEANTNEL